MLRVEWEGVGLEGGVADEKTGVVGGVETEVGAEVGTVVEDEDVDEEAEVEVEAEETMTAHGETNHLKITHRLGIPQQRNTTRDNPDHCHLRLLLLLVQQASTMIYLPTIPTRNTRSNNHMAMVRDGAMYRPHNHSILGTVIHRDMFSLTLIHDSRVSLDLI